MGSTGYLGGKVINHLLSPKINVSALVLQKSDTKGLESRGIQIIRGGLTEAETILPALKNIDAVITTASGFFNKKKAAT